MVRETTLRSLALLLLVVAAGTVGYVLIEGWPVRDALWMVFITLSTIGFSEVQPLSEAGRLFTMALVVGGLGVGTYALSQVGRAVVEGEFATWMRERRRKRMMKALEDHFIVVGYGRLGRVVARELASGGYPVCVVERNHEPGLSFESEGFLVIFGDGADDDVLREAGIERARGVAITVAPVAEAIFVTLSARQLNPTVPILTRVDSDASAVKARRAGASQVVSPHAMGAWRMALGLVRPHTTTLIDLATLAEHDEIMLDEIVVTAESGWVGSTLAELGLSQRYDLLVVGIRRAHGGLVPTPRGHTAIEAGDILIVLGEPKDVARLAGLVGGSVQ